MMRKTELYTIHNTGRY